MPGERVVMVEEKKDGLSVMEVKRANERSGSNGGGGGGGGGGGAGGAGSYSNGRLAPNLSISVPHASAFLVPRPTATLERATDSAILKPKADQDDLQQLTARPTLFNPTASTSAAVYSEGETMADGSRKALTSVNNKNDLPCMSTAEHQTASKQPELAIHVGKDSLRRLQSNLSVVDSGQEVEGPFELSTQDSEESTSSESSEPSPSSSTNDGHLDGQNIPPANIGLGVAHTVFDAQERRIDAKRLKNMRARAAELQPLVATDISSSSDLPSRAPKPRRPEFVDSINSGRRSELAPSEETTISSSSLSPSPLPLPSRSPLMYPNPSLVVQKSSPENSSSCSIVDPSTRSLQPVLSDESTARSSQSVLPHLRTVAAGASPSSNEVDLPLQLLEEPTVHNSSGLVNTPMARVATKASTDLSHSPSTRSNKSFLSSFLGLGSSSSRASSPASSPSGSPLLRGVSRSPSVPEGFERHLAEGSQTRAGGQSLPVPSSRVSHDGHHSSQTKSELLIPPLRRTPRSIAAATFSGLGLTRSSSSDLSRGNTLSETHNQSSGFILQPTSGTSTPSPSPQLSRSAARLFSGALSSSPTLGSSHSFDFIRKSPSLKHDLKASTAESLESINLTVNPLTVSLPLSRSAQPLCGALLDDKYLLIGTTAGLDFLPLPTPDAFSNLKGNSGSKRRKQTRKPIALIKRTRFKELAVLSERSNILLAIAGRNDHIRVYALDGIRAMIEKKLSELDMRDGYACMSHHKKTTPLSTPSGMDPKGKAKAQPQTSRCSEGALPEVQTSVHSSNIPPAEEERASILTPPPDYTPSPSPRSVRPFLNAMAEPPSPVRARAGGPSLTDTFVRAVPKNPRATPSRTFGGAVPVTPRALHISRSRDFAAPRRGTSVIVPKHHSMINLNAESTSSTTAGSSASSTDLPDESEGGLVPTRLQRHSFAAPGASLSLNGGATFNRLNTPDSSTSAISPDQTVPPKLQPRIEPLRGDIVEPSMLLEMAGFIRNSGPDPSQPRTTGSTPITSKPSPVRQSFSGPSSVGGFRRRTSSTSTFTAREPTSPPLRSDQQSALLHLAEIIRETGPTSSSSPNLSLLSDTSAGEGFKAGVEEGDEIRGVSPFTTTMTTATAPTTCPSLSNHSASAFTNDSGRVGVGGGGGGHFLQPEHTLIDSGGNGGASPDVAEQTSVLVSEVQGALRNRRWSFNPLMRNRSPGLDSQSAVMEDSHRRYVTPTLDAPEASPIMERQQQQQQQRQQPSTEPQPPSHLRSAAGPTNPQRNSKTTFQQAGGSSSISSPRSMTTAPKDRTQPESHPASLASPLEHVKLARTKGARLLRAVETKKRTHLAVLCGEEGERIELFTGARNISLSLNRTFVLPESPRSIELQLQGHDLVDLYLIYHESIFALEPNTVRVREVGVGRSERRYRRERERRMQEESTGNEPLHHQDVLLHPSSDDDTSDQAQDRLNQDSRLSEYDDLIHRGNGAMDLPPPTPVQLTSPVNRPPTASNAADATAGTGTGALMDGGTNSTEPLRQKNPNTLPYTTFQQLPFIPPVPSCVLSSAWTIPPLYTDVIENRQGQPPEKDDSTPPHDERFPLLSPISLLGGTSQRSAGPPGLFFVSKGKHLSGIVTGDGRSVIKRPLVWSLDKASITQNEASASGEHHRRLEVLITKKSKTVVVGIATDEIKAIAVGETTLPNGSHQSAAAGPFGNPILVTSANPSGKSMSGSSSGGGGVGGGGESSNLIREVQHLGTHRGTNQLFYSERVGSHVTIYCLAGQPE